MIPNHSNQEKFYNFKRQTTFGIRKWTIGVVSVSLGTAIVATAPTASADNLDTTPVIEAVAEAPEEVALVDKTALTQAVEVAKAVDLSQANPEVAEAFVDVFTQATGVLNSTTTTQEDVDAILVKLNAAVEAIQSVAAVEVTPTAFGIPVDTPEADAFEVKEEKTQQSTPSTEELVIEEAELLKSMPADVKLLASDNGKVIYSEYDTWNGEGLLKEEVQPAVGEKLQIYYSPSANRLYVEASFRYAGFNTDGEEITLSYSGLDVSLENLKFGGKNVYHRKTVTDGIISYVIAYYSDLPRQGITITAEMPVPSDFRGSISFSSMWMSFDAIGTHAINSFEIRG